MPMYVAVVYKHHDDTAPRSHKPHGDYSCFVAGSKDEAVSLAYVAVRQWEGFHSGPFDPSNGHAPAKYYGPYRILVGQLTEEAFEPVELADLEEVS